MDIEWLGRSCFRLKRSGLSILTDPFTDRLAFRNDIPEVDVITLSHLPAHDGDLTQLPAKRKVFRGAGEFEIGGVFITGVKTFRDAKRGAERGPNTVYRFKIEGVRLCHLGSIGHIPDSAQVTVIGDLDILLVPVGGDTLTPPQAAETAALFSPKIVIPMPIRTPGSPKGDPVDALVKELGLTATGPLSRFTVTASSLGAQQRIVLFKIM